jgi:hypothetical protein
MGRCMNLLSEYAINSHGKSAAAWRKQARQTVACATTQQHRHQEVQMAWCVLTRCQQHHFCALRYQRRVGGGSRHQYTCEVCQMGPGQHV